MREVKLYDMGKILKMHYNLESRDKEEIDR